MRRFTGTIESATPFLFNRYVDTLEAEEAIGKMPRDATKIDVWRKKEAELRVYSNGEGLFLPARNIRSAMVEGARAIGIRHVMNGRKVALWPYLRRGLVVEPNELLFGVETTKKLKGENMGCFSIPMHGDMVRVPPQKGALVRKYWPKLEEWKLTFTLAVFDDSLQEEAELQEAIKAAGVYCGLGTGRPDYGKFKLAEWAEEKAA